MVDFEKELNKEQLKVVYKGEGPCLVLSGPGSGKTRTLVYRVAYLLQKGIPPSRILLLTFTKKAAKEMLYRISLMSPDFNEKVCGGTFHHVANLFLRRYASRIGYNPDFIIIDEEDSKSIISAIIKEKENKELPKAQVMQKIISLAVNSQKEERKIIEKYFPYFDEEIAKEILEVAKEYKKRKKESNVMDYDDLLLNWKSIMSFSDIGDEISERFLYVLIDEYQDTNVLQDIIIKKISKKNNNILVVGDDAQSIYSFRAANIKNILNFAQNYQHANVFKLETNYRSTPEILEMADMVIKNNKNRLDKELKSVKKKSGYPSILPFSNPLKQAEFISDYIEKQENLSDVAILLRAHHHGMELEMELTRRGIPYITRGGVRFFEQLHIKDILAFLRILVNYRDESSWKRLLLRQKGIGEANSKKIISKITQKRKIEDLFREKDLLFSSFSSSICEGVKKLLNALEKSLEKEIPQKIDVFLNDFYEQYLDFSFENSGERKSDLQRLRELSSGYDSLQELVADFSLSEEPEQEYSQAVVLSTIHQAKGLEWGTLFIISLKEGDFPHLKAIEEDLIEEERRLFYVAVTRCKENLFLTYPNFNFREKYIAPPSRFLKEAQGVEEEIIEDEEIIEEDGEWMSM